MRDGYSHVSTRQKAPPLALDKATDGVQHFLAVHAGTLSEYDFAPTHRKAGRRPFECHRTRQSETVGEGVLFCPVRVDPNPPRRRSARGVVDDEKTGETAGRVIQSDDLLEAVSCHALEELHFEPEPSN